MLARQTGLKVNDSPEPALSGKNVPGDFYHFFYPEQSKGRELSWKSFRNVINRFGFYQEL